MSDPAPPYPPGSRCTGSDHAGPFPALLGPAIWVVIGLLALSGIGLSFHYVATPSLAHESLQVMEAEVSNAPTTRSLHYHASLVVVALLIAQFVWLLLSGGYRASGRWSWWCTIGVLLTLVLADVTGQLLRWDQAALYATEVRVGILAGSPIIGESLQNALVGGDTLGAPTLVRFYALHIAVVPLLLGALGWYATTRRDSRESGPRMVSAALLALAAGASTLIYSLRNGAPLGDLGIVGESSEFAAAPEWYMVWLNQLIAQIGSPLITYGLPGLLIAWLIGIPLIDPTGARRRVVWSVSGVFLALMVTFTLMAPNLDDLDRPFAEPQVQALPQPTGLSEIERRGYVLARTQGCTDCHGIDVSDTARFPHWGKRVKGMNSEDQILFFGDPDSAFAKSDHKNYPMGELVMWTDDPAETREFLAEFEAKVRDPESEMGSFDMPASNHLSHDQIRAMGLFFMSLARPK